MDTSYNDIPYMGRVHSQTHIERLALAAQIFGIETVPLEHARVLELGCGDGSNLVNMALNLPNAHFVGIDGSEVHIVRGREMAQTAQASNVQLEAMDITAITDQFGQFDYILCHGVFSWVPENVRDHILRISRECMTPLGIGYISYNAYPAWKQHEMLRDMMRFHAFRMEDPKEQILQARALVQFIGEHVPDTINNSYGKFINSQVEFISGLTEEYLYHEYLEAHNQPYWFYEFIKLLDANELQYLGDTDLSSMINLHWPEETRDLLNHISPTQYELEQYMDMLRCRRFRCSTFVHHAREVTRGIEPKVFTNFYYSYKACDKWITPEPKEGSTDESTEGASTGNTETSSSDEIIAALPVNIESNNVQGLIQVALFQHLHEQWPKRVHFKELVSLGEQTKGANLSDDEQISLAELMQTLYLKEVVQAHLYAPQIANDIPTHPKLNGVARHQATYQEVVSTQLHDMVIVRDEWVRSMVTLMDGTRTVPEISEGLYTQMSKGDLPTLECEDDDGNPITHRDGILKVLQTRIMEILASFLENGALM